MIFNKTDRFLRSPQFGYDRLAAFQNEIAQQVSDSLELWHPPYTLNEIVDPVVEGSNIILAWVEVERDPVGGRIIEEPVEYAVYRSDEPFRKSSCGELIATVTDIRYIDEEPLNGRAFYRIEARY